MPFSVRGLAAIDLHGARETVLHRRLVLAEFVAASILGLVVGGWTIARGGGAGWLIGGALLGIGANYLALAIYAVELSRSGGVRAQVARLGDLPSAQRYYYGVAQIRLLVPV